MDRSELLDKIEIHKKDTVTLNIKKIRAELEILEDREDIKTFLSDFKKKQIKNEFPFDRIIEYLKEQKLIKDQNLTKRGEDVLECGKWARRECGYYNFFYDDSIRDSRKILVKCERLNETPIRTSNKEYINLYNIHPESYQEFFMPDKSNNKNTNQGKVVKVWNDTTPSKDVNESERTVIKKNGEIKYQYKIADCNDTLHVIDANYNEKEFINDIRSYCNSKNITFNESKCKGEIEFSDLSDTEKEENYKNNDEIKNLFLTPKEKSDADEWYEYLLNKKIRKRYYLKSEYEKLTKDISDNYIFEEYKPDKCDNIEDYILKLGKQKNVEYWHLAAPYDLLVEYTDYKPFTISESEDINFESIASRLCEDRNNVSKIIYADKYILKREHYIENFKKLKNAICERSKAIIISNRSHNTLRNNSGDFTYVANDEIDKQYGKTDWHERYLIIELINKDSIYWKVTRGIDFINVESNKFKDCDFIPVNISNLPEALRKFVEENSL